MVLSTAAVVWGRLTAGEPEAGLVAAAVLFIVSYRYLH